MRPNIQFVVTAGPTREHLDPVRFLSNPSTGRMGFAVARAARRAGYPVTLVTGPVALRTPKGVARVDVISAREMLAAVERTLRAVPPGAENACCLVMTAAVADWRPAACATRKLKKGEMSGTLALVRNPDILRTIQSRFARPPFRLVRVGFAAETGAPAAEAARKCREKGLDLVVGNDVTEKGCGFGTTTNRVTFVHPDGACEPLPLMSKDAVARRIVAFCVAPLARGE